MVARITRCRYRLHRKRGASPGRGRFFDPCGRHMRPAGVVVNLSIGTDFGPHDGTMAWEQTLASYVGPQQPGRALVVAAGNSGSIGPGSVHESVHVSSGTTMRVPITTQGAQDGGVQVWVAMHAGAKSREVGIDSPDGTWISPVDAGSSGGKTTDLFNVAIYNGSQPSGSPVPARGRNGAGGSSAAGQLASRHLFDHALRQRDRRSLLAGNGRCRWPGLGGIHQRCSRGHHQLAGDQSFDHRRRLHHQQAVVAEHPRHDARSFRAGTRFRRRGRHGSGHTRRRHGRAVLVLQRRSHADRRVEAGEIAALMAAIIRRAVQTGHRPAPRASFTNSGCPAKNGSRTWIPIARKWTPSTPCRSGRRSPRRSWQGRSRSSFNTARTTLTQDKSSSRAAGAGRIRFAPHPLRRSMGPGRGRYRDGCHPRPSMP